MTEMSGDDALPDKFFYHPFSCPSHILPAHPIEEGSRRAAAAYVQQEGPAHFSFLKKHSGNRLAHTMIWSHGETHGEISILYELDHIDALSTPSSLCADGTPAGQRAFDRLKEKCFRRRLSRRSWQE